MNILSCRETISFQDANFLDVGSFSHTRWILLCFPSLYHTVSKAALGKVAAGAFPAAAFTAPAFALDSVVEALPTNTVALEVQFAAYLAVTLGTLLPCLFLINLFIQTESRRAGREGGQDAE